MTPTRWARVKGVLEIVLRGAPPERPDLVRRLCDADESLAAEVRGLVQAAEADGPLDDPPAVESASQPTASTESTELRAGRAVVIGPYRLTRRIGRGGMGEVFLATDVRLHREVAVKVLNPRLDAQPRFAQHLLREARAAARLSHPNIASVYDVIDDGGRVSLVMEYLPGETLAARLQRGALPLGRVVDYGRQMAAALHHAHEHGLLHCDFKPANVVITPEDRVKVLDFGLARRFAQTESDAVGASPSLIRHRAGTPAYMAPEHRLGLSLGPPADVFALGIVLHEMATGHRPLGLDGPPAPDSTTRTAPGVVVVDAALPRALRAVIERATMADPSRRTQTAAEVIASLDRMHQRRKVRRSTVVAALLAVLAGVPALRLLPTGTPALQESDWAVVADFAGPSEDRTLARTVREAVVISLQQSRFVNILSDGRVADALARMQLQRDVPIDEATGLEICRREGARALLAGTLARAGDTTQLSIRGIDGADGRLLFVESDTFSRPDEVFDVVDGLARRVRRHLGESLAGIQGTSAPLQKVTTRSFEALRRYTEAVDARARARVDDVEVPLLAALAIDPEFAMAHLKLGDFYLGISGDTARAIRHLSRAHELSDRVTERERHYIAALYFSAVERYDAARDSLKVLVSLYPDDPEIRYELAMAHYSVEDMRGGVAELREALRLNPRYTRAAGSLVLMLARDDRPQEALDEQRRAAEAGVDSPFLHWGGALARLALGDSTGAVDELRSLRAAGGFFDRLGRLEEVRAALFRGEVAEAFALYGDVLRVTRAAGDLSLELSLRAIQGRTHLVVGHLREARAEAAAILRAPSPATGAEDLRRAGALAADAGDVRSARLALARLEALRRESPSAFVTFSVEHLTGAIALAEQRWPDAEAASSAASSASPWYESWLGSARAFEARRDWPRALAERRRVTGSLGRILRDGFPLDWRLNQLAMARVHVHLDQCVDAREAAAEPLRVFDQAGGALDHVVREVTRELDACPAALPPPGR